MGGEACVAPGGFALLRKARKAASIVSFDLRRLADWASLSVCKAVKFGETPTLFNSFAVKRALCVP